MTTALVATDSVHTTAAAADYLTGRDDLERAVGVAVTGADLSERDAKEALNVLSVRLPAVAVETHVLEGSPAARIREAAAEHAADELVVGRWSGDPGTDPTVGTTAVAVVEETDRPVVLVPVEAL
jgi:nucleotide-binding universal stress UspA family protein